MTPLSPADVAAAEAIRVVIDRRGTDWLCAPRQCESILNDLLATHYDDEYGSGREGRLVINILAAAARCGVPSDLAKHRARTANLSLESMQTKWIKCLCNTEGKSEPLAERAIDIWAAALGIVLGPRPPKPQRDEPPPPQRDEPPPPQQQEQQEPKPPTRWWPWIAAAVAVALLLGAVAIVTTDAGQELRNRVVAWVWPKPPPAPQATAMRVASDRIYKSGDAVEISVAFSRPVTVTGRPRIRFTAGADPAERVARFQKSDGAALVTFVFDVPDGIESEGIDMGANPSIDLAGGTVVDAANGTAARLDLRGSEPRNLAAVRIDSKPPRVQRVDLPRPRDYVPGEVLELAVEFSEPVTIVGAPGLELRLGDAVRKTDSGVRPDGRRLVFRYTIQPDDPPTSGIETTALVLEAGAIGDHAGNQAEPAAVARSERVGIVRPQPPPLKDRIDVTLPAGRSIRLLLVEAGNQEIPEAMLQEYPQYKAGIFNMPTTLEIASPFYIGQTEVTPEDFADVVGQPPKAGTAGISWDEAIQFCNALSQREGLTPCYRIDPAPAGGGEPRVTRLADGDGFRLPLPEEWVYACLISQRREENIQLEKMTSGVSEWSDLRPGDTLPFAHGGYDALPKEQPPTFLMRRKRSDTPADCGFRIVRSAGQPAPNP